MDISEYHKKKVNEFIEKIDIDITLMQSFQKELDMIQTSGSFLTEIFTSFIKNIDFQNYVVNKQVDYLYIKSTLLDELYKTVRISPLNSKYLFFVKDISIGYILFMSYKRTKYSFDCIIGFYRSKDLVAKYYNEKTDKLLLEFYHKQALSLIEITKQKEDILTKDDYHKFKVLLVPIIIDLKQKIEDLKPNT